MPERLLARNAPPEQREDLPMPADDRPGRDPWRVDRRHGVSDGYALALRERSPVTASAHNRDAKGALARRLRGLADAIPAIAALLIEIFLQMLRVR